MHGVPSQSQSLENSPFREILEERWSSQFLKFFDEARAQVEHMDEFSFTLRFARVVSKEEGLYFQTMDQSALLCRMLSLLSASPYLGQGESFVVSVGRTPNSPRVALDRPIGSSWLNIPKHSTSDQIGGTDTNVTYRATSNPNDPLGLKLPQFGGSLMHHRLCAEDGNSSGLLIEDERVLTSNPANWIVGSSAQLRDALTGISDHGFANNSAREEPPRRASSRARLGEPIWQMGLTLGGNEGHQKLRENHLKIPYESLEI
eukprot:1144940-Pelagomonas_calceolata.AAC.5